MHKCYMLTGLCCDLAAGGLLLLAIGLGRYPHPQDLAVISASAYTYYFAQSITDLCKNLQLLAIRIKQLAAIAKSLTVFYYFVNKLVEKDPHPPCIFHNVKRHFTWRNTPVTVLGPRTTPPVY